MRQRLGPIFRRVAVALLLCAGSRAALAAAPTVDPAQYLAQLRCPDGSLPLQTACTDAAPQTATDPMFWRRHDWPAPAGHQISDSVVSADGSYYETTWSYPPFGVFAPANGDGGEVYKITAGTVTIVETQDGGKPGMQYFVGAACWGTGWIAFRSDAPTGHWSPGIVARLLGTSSPLLCFPVASAYTQYRLEAVAIPFIVFGVPETVTVQTVIAEHYNAASVAGATALERSFFGLGWGRLIWEAWRTTPPTSGDLPVRCPGTAYSTAPAPGWYLNDCRYSTNIVAADGALSVAGFGWP
jgi:hypothetical protein